MFTVFLVDGFYDIAPGEVIEYIKDHDSFAARMALVKKDWMNSKKVFQSIVRITGNMKSDSCNN